MRREHWLFFYPCGCTFSVMAADVWPTEGSAWAEAFDTPGRIQLARDHGVTCKKITSSEWSEKYMATFGECTHRPDPDPLSHSGVDDLDLDQLVIDHRVEQQINAYWEGVYKLLEEGAEVWEKVAAVVDKVAPALAPWDRREAVFSIVDEFKQVTDADS